MAVNLSLAKDSAINYPAHFQRAIVKGVGHLLRLAQEVTQLSHDTQEQALHLLSYALKLDEAWPVARDLLLTMSHPMEQAGYRDEWLGYLETGLAQSLALWDVEAEAELRFHLGILYKHLARFEEAQSQFESSAKHFENVGNVTLLARTLNRLAYVARHQRHFAEARRQAELALEFSHDVKEEQAYSYFVLGILAFDQRDWQKACHFFSKSLVLREETNNKRLIAWGLTNLGLAQQALKRYNDAATCYDRAINLFETIHDPVHQAIARMNLGNVYLERGRFSEALNLYALAEPIFRDRQDRVHLAMVNNNKGIAYRSLESWDKAEQAYRISVELWRQLGHISALVNVMDGLGLVYLAQAMYQRAIATFEDALESLTQIENDPSYDHHLTTVSKHLRQARELSRGSV